ncbi:MAG: sulfur carrier protein ThiS [Bdellovibrionales bacterium]|nr:sulfur carrier protein ThiS [Bdellovibrionales bacterium]
MSGQFSIIINNESCLCSEGEFLLQVLEEKKLAQQQGIAVAVNNTVISKNSWSTYSMKEGDRVLIVTASQGG